MTLYLKCVRMWPEPSNVQNCWDCGSSLYCTAVAASSDDSFIQIFLRKSCVCKKTDLYAFCVCGMWDCIKNLYVEYAVKMGMLIFYLE